MLEARAAELWAKPLRESRLLLHSLISNKSGDPVRAWIAANADKISEIAPISASISPEAAAAVTRKDGRLNLAGHNSADCRLQATALWRVGAVERDLAIAVIEADKARISDTNRDLVVESEHSACRPLAAFPPRRHPSWYTSS